MEAPVHMDEAGSLQFILLWTALASTAICKGSIDSNGAQERTVRVYERAPHGTIIHRIGHPGDATNDVTESRMVSAMIYGKDAPRFAIFDGHLVVDEYQELRGSVGDSFFVRLSLTSQDALRQVTSEVTLRIVVSNRNYFAPSHLAQEYTAEVLRYSEPGRGPLVVAVVQDDDVDAYNRETEFHLNPRSGFLEIGDRDGVVRTKAGLHKAPSVIVTEVVAMNTGSPPLSSSRRLTVHVRDLSEPVNVTVRVHNRTSAWICWGRPLLGQGVLRYELLVAVSRSDASGGQRREWREARPSRQNVLCQAMTDLDPTTTDEWKLTIRGWTLTQPGMATTVRFNMTTTDVCRTRPCPVGRICLPGTGNAGYRCMCPDRPNTKNPNCTIEVTTCHETECDQSGGTSVPCAELECGQSESSAKCDCTELDVKKDSHCGDCAKQHRQPISCGADCLLQHDPPSAGVICQNGGTQIAHGEGVRCACEKYYRGLFCEEYDPCVASSAEGIRCLNGGTCRVSNLHELRCDCPKGFHGDLCELVSRCAAGPCQNGGYCRNVVVVGGAADSDYHCFCYDGFYGRNCTHYDPCSSSPCQNNGHCRNLTDTDYTCRCQPGFHGDNCELYSPCADNPCLFNGMCNSIDGRYVCDCEVGRFGRRCERVNLCLHLNPCGAHSLACHNVTDTSYKCICEPGWLSENCSKFNACFNNPCSNDGTCLPVPSLNSFQCACAPGYWGDRCQTMNPCSSQPCQNSGSCQNTSKDGFVCKCPPWYYGDFCQHVSSCAAASCANGADCLNTSATHFRCICRPAYFGEACQYFNTCYPSPCARGSCHLESFSGDVYSCRCPNGYYGSNCQHYDPCASRPCQNDGRCTSVGENAFECSCKNLYFGDACQNLDACHENPCLRGGSCVNVPPTDFHCVCPTGSYGPLCESLDPCADQPCRNGGTCFAHTVPSVGTGTGFGSGTGVGFASGVRYRCQCAVGYHGISCENLDLCHLRPCLHGGTCMPVGSGRYACQCDIEFQGENCQLETPCHVHGKRCYNDGLCRREPTGGKTYCQCPDGYFGFRCQNYDPCSTGSMCVNGGTCQVMENGMYHCSCQPGFFGEHCELHRPCNIYVCKFNATCVHTATADLCYCKPGFAGRLCEQDLDECESRPCLNGGTCIDLPGRYACNCPEGFAGDSCHRVDMCSKETTVSAKGVLVWPSTIHTSQAKVECPRSLGSYAIRFCRLEENRRAVWLEQDLSNCPLAIASSEEAIEALDPYLTYDLTSDVIVAEVITLLDAVLSSAYDNPQVARHMFTILDRLLSVPEPIIHDSNSSAKLLRIIDDFLSNVKWLADNVTIVSTNIEIEVRHITWVDHDSGTTYVPRLDPDVRLFLPPEVFQRDISSDRVKFIFVRNSKLFRSSYPLLYPVHSVISASIGTGSSDAELKFCVRYSMLSRKTSKNNRCVFWNSAENVWSSDGVETISYRGEHITCCSYRLTYFSICSDPAVAVSSYVQEDIEIMIATHLGLGLAIVCLVLVLFTYAIFRSLNKEDYGQIIIQLTGSMLAMNVCLLVAYNRFKVDSVGICLAIAILAHFFTLSTFAWLTVMGHFMLRQVSAGHPFHEKCFLCKRILFTWGLPLIPVALSSGLDHEGYIKSPERCFLSEDNRYVYCGTYLLPVVLVFLSSTVLFLWLIRYIVCCDRCCAQSVMKKSQQNAIGVSQIAGSLLITLFTGSSWVLFYASTLDVISGQSVQLLYVHCALQGTAGFLVLVTYLVCRSEALTACRGNFRRGKTDCPPLTSASDKNETVQSEVSSTLRSDHPHPRSSNTGNVFIPEVHPMSGQTPGHREMSDSPMYVAGSERHRGLGSTTPRLQQQQLQHHHVNVDSPRVKMTDGTALYQSTKTRNDGGWRSVAEPAGCGAYSSIGPPPAAAGALDAEQRKDDILMHTSV